MKLIILAALTALCSAAKLDNTYLPPVSAKTAGGSEASLKTPLGISDELPAGSFVNEAQGVVVDAAAAGTRAASGSQESGLGGSRTSYGSTVSKVGEAAFTDEIPNTFARIAPIPEHETVVGPVYGDKVFQSKTLLPHDSKDYNSNTLSYENNVESHKYNFGFQTDNGIAVGENGVSKDGIHAQGGYSYKGNDGQTYKVTYSADKGGYQPQGSHLPTPHPIPDDIVKSIEQNAKDEATGHYDDGSYNSQKYNAEGDYVDTSKYDDKQGQFEKRPESQPNGVIINQNSQTGSIFGSVSGSTAKPQILNDYKPGQESTQTGHGQIFSTGSTGAYGALGSSSFDQNAQGIHSGAPSKPQFGQTSFGSQYTANQFGSQFAQGSKPTFSSQPVTTQFGFTQESSQGFGGISSTPSTQTFTQFGSQTGKQKVSGSVVPTTTFSTISGSKPGFPAQGTLFGKPVTSSFGSSSTNFGQAEISDVVNGAYSPPLSTPKPQNTQYQAPQFGVSSTPAFGGRVPAFSSITPFFGSTASPQESSATATATVSGSQTSFGGLSPQVLGGLKRPSTVPSGQYTSEEKISPKPTLSSVQQTVSELTYTQETQEGTFSSGGTMNKDTVSSSVTSSIKPSKTEPLAPKPGSKPVALTTLSETSSTFTSQSQGFSSAEADKQPQLTGFQVNAQKPTFGQQSQEVNQGYKYNQPTKPFGTPSIKPQGSTFSGVSSGQYNSASSTTSQGSGSYQPSFSGVTQAATSPFPSPSPTPVTVFPQKPFSQSSSTVFGQKPPAEKEQTQFGQESSVSTIDSEKTTVASENTPSVPTQQYTGELYQYNKPEPVSPAVTPSSLNAFGQPTQSTFSQGSLTSSQFGQGSAYGNKPFGKPQFGFTQGSQTSAQFGAQKTQQVTTQFGVKPQGFQTTQTPFGYKPFGSQFSTQGTKPQFGQTTQTQGSSFTQTQSTQQTVGNVIGTQQLGQTQPQKPFGGFQFGVSGNKPQGSQVSEGSSLLQSNQQTVGSVTETQKQTTPVGIKPQVSSFTQSQSTQQTVVTNTQQLSQTQPQKPFSGSVTEAQKQTTQFGVKPHGFPTTETQFGVKPVGTLFVSQGSKPQFGQTTQTQGSSFTQTQSTQQLEQPQKPFGGSQLSISETKPHFGQESQTSEGGSVLQSNEQIVLSVTDIHKQTTQGSPVQTGYLPPAPLSITSTLGVQETKPQFGQGTQTSQGTSFQQTTQQTVGLTTQDKTSQSQLGVQTQKPFGATSQFGTQSTKPQFGEGSQSSQGNSFQQSTQQTVGSTTQGQTSQSQFGVQPQKPFGTVSLFGSQTTKPQFGQGTQTSQGSGFQQSTQNTQPTFSSGIKGQTSQSQFGVQTQKPFGTASQFGIQGSKLQFGQGTQSSQGSSFQESSQQTVGSTTQGLTSQSQLGIQTQKPFGTTSQFGQGTQTSQGSTTQQSFGSGIKGQTSQSQFGVQTQKPFGTTSQFGQGTQTSQGSSTQQSFGSEIKGQTSQSQFGVQTQKPFGTTSQFGQGTQTSQGSTTQQSFGSGIKGQTSQSQFGVQTQKPFSTTSQFSQGTQTSQGSSNQQSFGSGIKGQNSQSQFGVQPQKPFGSVSQFGTQGSKLQFSQGTQTSQGSSFQQSTQQTVGSTTQGQSSQSQFGVQPQKPFGTVSLFGSQSTKPQFGQGTQTSQGSGFQQSTQNTQQTFSSGIKGQTSQSQFGVQTQKPFGTVSQFGTQGSKFQFGQGTQSSQGSSFQESSQQTVGSTTQGLTSQSQLGIQTQKPFGTTSQFGQGSQTSQGSSTQQSFGSGIKGQTSQSQFGVQTQKPIGTTSQFGQGTQTSQGTTTQQSFGSGIKGQTSQSQFGVQSQKPFSTTSQFSQGTQTSQGSSTQQTLGSGIKGQTTQSQFGVQPQKPFGTVSQFGTQGYKPFGQTSQTTYGSTFQQSSQQTFGSAAQGQTSQSKFESQTSKPFGSTFQFGSQGNKPQFGQAPQKAQGFFFQQTPVTSQTGSVSNIQSTQGSFTKFGSQTSKPFGTQFGVQGTKPQVGQVPHTTQGSSFTPPQATQQTIGADTHKQSTFGSQSQVGTQTYKPFGSQSQFGTQGSKPQFGQVSQTSQETSVTQTQTTQQTTGSVTQQTAQPQTGYLPPKLLNPTIQIGIQAIKPILGQAPSSQGSTIQQSSQTTQQTVDSTTTTQSLPVSQGLLGSQSLLPISITTQLGVQATKPQETSSQTQTVEQSKDTVTQQESGQGSSTFGSQSQISKPFETTSQFGVTNTKPQFGQVSQTSQGSSLGQTQTTQQIVGSIPITQQHQGSHTHFGSQTYKPFGSTQISSQGTKPQFGQVTQTSQQNTFTQSQITQQSSYNKANQQKPFISSSPALFTTAFGTQPVKTQFGSTSQNTQSSTTTTGSTVSHFGQSTTHGSTQFGSQSGKPFSTSHHQEAKPQFGAPTKPVFGQSSTTYTPFTNTQHSQTQFGSQYKPFGSSPVSAFGKYQPKPQFGQTGYTGFSGFGTAQASASATTSQQPFRGTLFGRPVGSTLTHPIKSQFGQPSFASAFASSSSGLPEYVPGTKFTVQPYATPSTVLPTAQPGFGQPTIPTLGQEVSGTQSTSVTSAQGSEVSVSKPLNGGVKVPALQPLGSKPSFGFSKPCCQSQFGQSTTQAPPSYQVSSTTPSSHESPSSQSAHDLHTVQGSGQKTDEFKGPKQPQRFDEKTGYYY